ncbi:SUMO1 sentrin specific peptidase 8 [Coemansia sp. Benny D115]|nr:SUMO1 sentrin specific peptidase 8 [Coemansia sp. Benny D115]
MVSDLVVLDFENAEVRTSDYDSLKPEGWLTGEIINFYWTYLERREFSTEPSVLFLGTYTAYRISNAENAQVTDNISKQLAQELGSKRHLILIPLNHRNHWSLLVYCRLTRTFYHYDSINRHNRDFAERAAGRFLRVLEPRMKEGFYFKSMQTPQQNNDHDCGIYVLAIAEELARRYINHLRKERSILSSKHSAEKKPAHKTVRIQEPPVQSTRCSKDTAAQEYSEASKQKHFQERIAATDAYNRLNGARDFGEDISARSQTLSAVSSSQHQQSRKYLDISTMRVPSATVAAPGRALASDLLMPRFGQPFSGFQSPFDTVYRGSGCMAANQHPAEPLLRGGGQEHGCGGTSGRGANGSSARTREERLKLETDMMEKAGLPRDFWQVTVEDIEYPHCMRKRIRTLVVDLRRNHKSQQSNRWSK